MYCSCCYGRFLQITSSWCLIRSANMLLGQAWIEGSKPPHSVACFDCWWYILCCNLLLILSVRRRGCFICCGGCCCGGTLSCPTLVSILSIQPLLHRGQVAINNLPWREVQQDVGSPWLCIPGAGMGCCREVRQDVGSPWLCVPGAGMGYCRVDVGSP